MTAYYNEHDPVSAEWLRRLVQAGLIAPGEVDERDIRDITPDELAGYTQCHFFAGIGIWSGALRAAGWPDDRPIWSGSCPCQPFSAAGRGEGVADERHLWPHWYHLVEQCKPDVLVGEQVASKDGLGWNDLVSADLERAGYSFGSVDLCAAGFGLDWRSSAYAQWLERAIHSCPDPMVARQLCNFADWADQSLAVGGLHIRQRQYFVGLHDAAGARCDPEGSAVEGEGEGDGGRRRSLLGVGRQDDGVADTDGQGSGAGFRGGGSGGRGDDAPAGDGDDERMADGKGRGRGKRRNAAQSRRGGHADSGGDLSGRLPNAPSDRREMAVLDGGRRDAPARVGEANVAGGIGAHDGLANAESGGQHDGLDGQDERSVRGDDHASDRQGIARGMADSNRDEQREGGGTGGEGQSRHEPGPDTGRRGGTGGLADPMCDGAGHRSGQGVGAEATPDRGDGGLSGERLRAGVENSSGGLGDSERSGLEGHGLGPAPEGDAERGGEGAAGSVAAAGGAGRLADVERDGRGAGRPRDHGGHDRSQLDANGSDGRLSDADGGDASAEWEQRGGQLRLGEDDGSAFRSGSGGFEGEGGDGAPASPPDSGRSPFDWLLCRDGSWRATRPGTLPLAHAVAGRVGKLRAYGNGLDFETAKEFCVTVREIVDEMHLA